MEERILLATATYAAINLINSSGYTAAEVLDGATPDPTYPTPTQTFRTSFLGVDDVTITPSTAALSSDYALHIGDLYPPVTSANKSQDNNPSSITVSSAASVPPGRTLQGTVPETRARSSHCWRRMETVSRSTSTQPCSRRGA